MGEEAVGMQVDIHSLCPVCESKEKNVWFLQVFQHRLPLIPGWDQAGSQTFFDKKLLGVADMANRHPFHHSLISKYSLSLSDNSY